jgi:hypothetical protein
LRIVLLLSESSLATVTSPRATARRTVAVPRLWPNGAQAKVLHSRQEDNSVFFQGVPRFMSLVSKRIHVLGEGHERRHANAGDLAEHADVEIGQVLVDVVDG